MVRVWCLILLCASAPLAGCSKPELVKPGLSQDQVNADKEACWTYVLNTPEGRRKVKIVHALRVVTAGPVMLLTINRKNPREDSVNEAVFSDCMRDRGYTFSRKGS
jgi:hypothetical protein